MINSIDYSILSKRFIFLVIILFFCLFKMIPQNNTDIDSIKNNPYLYPFLGDMIESYFYLHYKLPETAKELIFDIKRIKNYKYNRYIDDVVKKVVIPKIKTNESNIKFLQKDNIFYVQINDSIYEEKGLSDYPCKYIKQYEASPYEPGYPFLKDNILYFNEDNQPIVNDLILAELNDQFKAIKFLVPKDGVEKSFIFFTSYETKYPYRIFLEYTIDKGLYNFCTKRKTPNNEYYNKQIKLLNQFCVENRLMRIVWFGFKHKESVCVNGGSF